MYIIKQHDTVPDLTAQLLEADLTAINLTTATSVQLVMLAIDGGFALKQPCTVTNAAQGRVAYSWSAGDTDYPATYNVEFEIHWGTDIQTVPNDGYVQIKIETDLG